MDILATLDIAQADAALIAQVERIADLQRWMTIAMALVSLALVAVGLAAVWLLLTARRMIKDAERTFERVAPQLRPALDHAQTAVTAVSDVLDQVRSRVLDLSGTFEDANRALREAGRAAEVRVRELGAVLDVVREEAQELLLDGAATAHGIHATARALREPRPTGRALRPEPPPPIPEEAGRTSHGQG